MMAGMEHPHLIDADYVAAVASQAGLGTAGDAALVLAMAERVVGLCADAADLGGGRLEMIHAVAGALESEPPRVRVFSAVLTERCALIAQQHDPEDDAGPGKEIRAVLVLG